LRSTVWLACLERSGAVWATAEVARRKKSPAGKAKRIMEMS
jgi:hypothetical protein